MYGPKTKVKDVVSLSLANCMKGKHILSGVLMDKVGKPLEQNGSDKLLSQERVAVTAQNSTFLRRVASRKIGLEFTFDTTKLAEDTVVFETLKYKEQEICKSPRYKR